MINKEKEQFNLIWEQKENNINIKWEILYKCHTYQAGNNRCDLCLTEKLTIMNNIGTLNRRSELMSTCRHRAKYKLNNL